MAAPRQLVPLPVLPRLEKGKKRGAGLAAEAAVYRGRSHAVGTISFGASCELETVAKLVSSFVGAFCPRDGLRVRVSRGTRCEVLPIRFSQTASISATQLARGGSVELTEKDFDAPVRPLFWVTSRVPTLDESDADAVRLSFGWCIARPEKERAELAIAEAMSVMIEAAADTKDCLAAVVTAQGRALTMAAPTLPYEALAGTVPLAEDARWLRRHVRSPGWQVLVPRARAKDLARPPPSSVSVQRVRSGLLVRAAAATPFALATTDELDTWLLPVLGP